MFGLGLKQRMRAAAGRFAALVFPGLTRQVRRGEIGGRRQWLKRIIASSELARLDDRGDAVLVQRALTGRWTSENMPTHYYDKFAARFEKMFQGPHARIVDWLTAHASGTTMSQVIEIGCGDGRALAALADSVPGVPHWVGVDINSEIIARNRITYADHEALEFVASDAVEWLSDHTLPGTLLMTYGGVMEYIAPGTLSEWFMLLKAKGGNGVLLVEPVDPRHDLARDPTSHVWGQEQSYSHNHRILLENAGFRIVEAAETTAGGYRWCMILADLNGEEETP